MSTRYNVERISPHTSRLSIRLAAAASPTYILEAMGAQYWDASLEVPLSQLA